MQREAKIKNINRKMMKSTKVETNGQVGKKKPTNIIFVFKNK
jgi:hypothetical protein